MRAVSDAADIAAVVLAAGSSTRLGRPKQTIEIGGETLVARAVRVATEAGFSPVIAVIVDGELIDSLKQMGATVLLNRQAYEGMASSIRAGVNWAKELQASGVVLMTCDQVTADAAHLRALIANPASITGSQYAGRIGVPAYFPASSFPALLQLQGDQGARDLLRGASAIPNEGLSLDIDTEADVARALLLFSES